MKEYTRFHKCLLVYKIYMFIYLLLAFNAFVNGQKLMQAATYAAAVFGGVLFLWMLKDYKQYWKMKNFILVIAFVLSYCLSAVMNMRYGIGENIQAVVWMVLQMSLLYLTSYQYTPAMMKKEFRILSIICAAYCTLANIISLSMLIWGFEYKYVDSFGAIHWIGYLKGRLWGVYDDPNHGAVITVLAVFCLMYLWKESKEKWQKSCIVISMTVQLLYIGFANSRTAIVAIGGGSFVWCFFKLISQKESLKKAVVLSAAVMLVAVIGLSGFEVVNEQVYKQAAICDARKKAANRKDIDKKKASKNARKIELEQDGSNGRGAIWLSGLEIAKMTPIYGASYRNMTEYAKENTPDTYIINNATVDYDSMHNIVVDVLVSQGIIGIIITIALGINTLVTLKKGMRHLKEEEHHLMIISFSIVTAMMLASLFYTYVFYLHAPQTYMFWLCLGYLVAATQKAGTDVKE